MDINAGKANSEKPTHSESDLKRPNWLVKVVRRLIPPGPGSRLPGMVAFMMGIRPALENRVQNPYDCIGRYR